MTQTIAKALGLDDKRIVLDYINWRGERRERIVKPLTDGLRFGTTLWHREPQWLLTATDCEDGVTKEFALFGIRGVLKIMED